MAEEEIRTKTDKWLYDRIVELIEKGEEIEAQAIVDEFLIYVADSGGDPRKYPKDALVNRAKKIIELATKRVGRRKIIEEIKTEKARSYRPTPTQYEFLRKNGWRDDQIRYLLEAIRRGIASVDEEGKVTDKSSIEYARATLGTLKRHNFKPQNNADIEWVKRIRELARGDLLFKEIGIREKIKLAHQPLEKLKQKEAELAKEMKEGPPWKKREYWPGLLRKPPTPVVEEAKKEGEEKKGEEKEEKKPPWEEKDFEALPFTEQEKARKIWYKEQKKDVRDKYLHEKTLYKAGKISRAEFRNRTRELKREKREKRREAYGPLGAKRAARFVGRGFLGMGKFKESSYGSYILKVSWLFGLFLVAGLFTYSFSIYFFWAFLSIALYVLIPPPEGFDAEEGKIGWGSLNPWNWQSRKPKAHTSFAWLRSIAKITAIIMFALAFRQLGDVFNAAFIATVFIGYFSMKVEFDPKYPGEFIESLLRFAVLGAYFIPFWVFGSIFQSYVLVAIAFAFFAIPPLPKADIKNLAEVLSQGLSGATSYYKMFDMIIFSLLMAFALMGALVGFPGWALTGALQKTFIYFWIVSFIGGLFSPVHERPLTGLLMLGGATIIYGIGPGSQEVGSALLGQWWPTVHNAVTDTFEPVVAVFDQLGQTFSNAFLLLTNPAGYATSILNGTYAENPTGKTGAFGVEINDFTVSQIYIQQAYITTVLIKNEGSYPARNIVVELRTGNESPLQTPPRQGGAPFPGGGSLPPIISEQKRLSITDLGFGGSDEFVTTKYVDNNKENKLIQQDVRQFLFQSAGISCNTVACYDLRARFIPLIAEVTYDYEVESNLEVEFLDVAEWERRISNRRLFTQQKLSKITTAPVKLSIGTLDQPIREETPFHIGALLASQEGKDSRINNALIEINFPNDSFKLKNKTVKNSQGTEIKIPDCTNEKNIYWTEGESLKPLTEINTDTPLKEMQEDGRVVWKFNKPEEIAPVYCQFEAASGFSEPSKTFLVKANATYSFSRWKSKDTKIEFTGTCPSTAKCSATPTTIPSGAPVFGSENYCRGIGKYRPPDYPLCVHGEGNCNSNAECDQTKPNQNFGTLECRRNIPGLSIGICCYNGIGSNGEQKTRETDEACKTAFENNKAQIKPPALPAEYAVCGNGICDTGETTTNCPQDCPAVLPVPQPTTFSQGTVIWSQMSGYSLTVEQVRAYLKQNTAGTKLENQGDTFYNLGLRYDIDPAFAVAVAMHESGYGTSDKARNQNNFFGLTLPGGETAGFRTYSTPEEGIEDFYSRIKNNYIPDGLDTPEEIASRYVATGRDAWVNNVPRIRAAVQPALQPVSPVPTAAYTICVDPGHGGIDPGNGGIDGSGYPDETDWNLDIGLRLEELLKNNGFTVVMTRVGDETLELGDRVNRCVNGRGNIFVSIHQNSGDPSASGTAAFYFDHQTIPNPETGTNNYRLANSIQTNLRQAIGTNQYNTGTIADSEFYGTSTEGHLRVLRDAQSEGITAALVEVAFLTNQQEFDLLNNENGRQAAAAGIYNGIVQYVNSQSA